MTSAPQDRSPEEEPQEEPRGAVPPPPAPYGTAPQYYPAYPPPSAAVPQYPYAQPQQATNGLAVSGLASAIVGVLFFGLILGPLAIVLGWLGLRKANTLPGRKGAGMSKWAIGLGVAETVFNLIVLAYLSTGVA